MTIPLFGGSTRLLGAARSSADIESIRADWRNFLPAGFEPPGEGSRLELSNEQWRERLTGAQYDVLREDGTERAFSSKLNDEKRAGIFICAGCELPLFSSAMKYDSGTGWPSFFTTVPGALATKRDYRYGWTRIEYHCVRCGGHQGHVFDDGPAPTRERWCNNGVALGFLARN
ncbi:MAG: peptide-methionine (R)-S-oxide reductase MsrB [Pseudomonadales bacterium]|nr:peptide-methionine (R)-S-oxide reductase MsrB [Pseudomonadales bacterium]